MVRTGLSNKYFEWMYRIVYDKRYSKKMSFRKLLLHLHNVEFTYTLLMDENRARDGIDLRYRFGYENRYSDSLIRTSIDDGPCSVLEMLIALAIRCEEHIMDEPELGNRTGKWFWQMIENMGLASMEDSRFDLEFIDDTLAIFLDRKYRRNGEGGLFTVNNCKHDMRDAEIWYQMCWYLDSIVEYSLN